MTVRDDGLASIEPLKTLTAIAIRGDKVTHNGIKHLSKNTALEYIYIDDLTFTSEMIAPLKSLTNLKALWLRGSKATRSDMRAAKKALPKCDVEFFVKRK